MTQELAKVGEIDSVINSLWSEKDKATIRAMCVPKEVEDGEYKVFLYQAATYGLDPLLKQIWVQKRKNNKSGAYYPATIMVTYGGMQEIANRSGELDGIAAEIIYDNNGKMRAAKSILWKKGCAHPFVYEADIEEFYPAYPSGTLWETKPKLMLKKCANANNLRQAFSLGRLYIPEEMGGNEGANVFEGEIMPESPKAIAPKQADHAALPAQPATPKEPDPALVAQLKNYYTALTAAENSNDLEAIWSAIEPRYQKQSKLKNAYNERLDFLLSQPAAAIEGDVWDEATSN